MLGIVLAGYGAWAVLSGSRDGDVAGATATPEKRLEKKPDAPKAWYRDQAPPPQLVTMPDQPLLPEPDAVSAPAETPEPAAPLAYEESLPKEVYVHPHPAAAVAAAPAMATAVPKETAVVPVPANTSVSSAAQMPQVQSEANAPQAVQVPVEMAWLRNAVPFPKADSRPMVAIVIDDMGVDRHRSAAIIDLPPPLTVSFLTYAHDLATQAALAKAAGHELMVHVAMEPSSKAVDPGPDVLLTSQDDAELRRRLEQGIGRVPGAIGINNHMGSRFTEDKRGMGVVLDVLRKHGLMFLDSRTSPKTVARGIAHRVGVAVVERNVFLDNENSEAAVLKRLAEVERLAARRGYAIAIGHPRDGTLKALAEWLPAARARGVQLVPLSAVVLRAEEHKHT